MSILDDEDILMDNLGQQIVETNVMKWITNHCDTRQCALKIKVNNHQALVDVVGLLKINWYTERIPVELFEFDELVSPEKYILNSHKGWIEGNRFDPWNKAMNNQVRNGISIGLNNYNSNLKNTAGLPKNIFNQGEVIFINNNRIDMEKDKYIKSIKNHVTIFNKIHGQGLTKCLFEKGNILNEPWFGGYTDNWTDYKKEAIFDR